MIVNAINSVASMALLVLLGFTVAGTKLFRANDSAELLAKYLARIATPAYLLSNTVSAFSSRELLRETGRYIYVPFALILGGLALGWVFSRLLRVQKGRRGVFINACGLGNTIFLGMPVAQAVLGDASLASTLSFYVANTLLFWSLGVYALFQDSETYARQPLFSRSTLRHLFSPPMVAFFAGLALAALGIPLPAFLGTALGNVAKTNTALGMMLIGVVMRGAPFSQGWNRDTVRLLVYKLLVLPCLALLLLRLLPVPEMIRRTTYLMLMMPGMSQLVLMSKESRCDSAFAASWVSLSTLVSLLSIPLHVWIMTLIL